MGNLFLLGNHIFCVFGTEHPVVVQRRAAAGPGGGRQGASSPCGALVGLCSGWLQGRVPLARCLMVVIVVFLQHFEKKLRFCSAFVWHCSATRRREQEVRTLLPQGVISPLGAELPLLPLCSSY